MRVYITIYGLFFGMSAQQYTILFLIITCIIGIRIDNIGIIKNNNIFIPNTLSFISFVDTACDIQHARSRKYHPACVWRK